MPFDRRHLARLSRAWNCAPVAVAVPVLDDPPPHDARPSTSAPAKATNTNRRKTIIPLRLLSRWAEPVVSARTSALRKRTDATLRNGGGGALRPRPPRCLAV